jgi:glucose/arabinose dehydrogenase
MNIINALNRIQLRYLFVLFFIFYSCEDNSADKKILVEKNVILESLSDKLNKPWGIAFLPDSSILITERSGSIYHYISSPNSSQSQMSIVNGVPQVIASGQGGMLDIVVHPNYVNNKLIFFTASHGTTNNFSTVLFRAEFIGGQLSNVKKIFQAADYNNTSNKHFGSRIVIDSDGFIFVGLGDRYNDRDYAQNLSYHNGKVIRIKDNGDIPKDNPFVSTPNAKPEIWSYGHRNIQGLAIHPETNKLWSHEHGPKGGDEINIIKKGANYGWPLATFGIDYDGSIISKDTTIAGAEDPIYHWTPSIAPCGMNFYNSDIIPEWKGNLFLGALAGKHLNKITIENNKVIDEQRLFQGLGRFRQVIEGPEGYLYFVTESPGQLFRIKPGG